MNSLSVNQKLNNCQMAQVSFKGNEKKHSNAKDSCAAGVAGLTTSGTVKSLPKAQKYFSQFAQGVKSGMGARRGAILTAAGKYCSNPLVKFAADAIAVLSLFDIANSVKVKGEKAFYNTAA